MNKNVSVVQIRPTRSFFSFMKIRLLKQNYFDIINIILSNCFSEIRIRKMDVKMNFWIRRKNILYPEQKFPTKSI